MEEIHLLVPALVYLFINQIDALGLSAGNVLLCLKYCKDTDFEFYSILEIFDNRKIKLELFFSPIRYKLKFICCCQPHSS